MSGNPAGAGRRQRGPRGGGLYASPWGWQPISLDPMFRVKGGGPRQWIHDGDNYSPGPVEDILRSHGRGLTIKPSPNDQVGASKPEGIRPVSWDHFAPTPPSKRQMTIQGDLRAWIWWFTFLTR